MRNFYRAMAIVAMGAMAPSAAKAGLEDEFAGVRSVSMGGAHRALGTSNDTLMLNPAGMALTPRYSVDFQHGYSPLDGLHHLQVSAVDSKTAPVSAAVGYTFDGGDPEGLRASWHRLYIASAYRLSESLAFGITQRNVWGRYTQEDGTRRKVTAANTGDIGLALRLTPSFSLAVTYQNIVRTKITRLLPPQIGMGLAYQLGVFALAADMSIDVRRRSEKPITYGFGAEYFAGKQYPLRIGFKSYPFIRKNGETAREAILSFGSGWVSQGGAIEVGFFRSFKRKKNSGIAWAIKFFL